MMDLYLKHIHTCIMVQHCAFCGVCRKMKIGNACPVALRQWLQWDPKFFMPDKIFIICVVTWETQNMRMDGICVRKKGFGWRGLPYLLWKLAYSQAQDSGCLELLWWMILSWVLKLQNPPMVVEAGTITTIESISKLMTNPSSWCLVHKHPNKLNHKEKGVSRIQSCSCNELIWVKQSWPNCFVLPFESE